ncbi:MAG: YbaN family protein [Bacteroidales bacterium]
MMRPLLIILGTLSLLLGLVGIFLPGLPTTPLVLLAAGLYSHSSRRLHLTLTRSRMFGPRIRQYQKNKGLTKKEKIYSLSLMWVMILLSAVFFIDHLFVKVFVLLAGLYGSYVMGIRLPTVENPKTQRDEPDNQPESNKNRLELRAPK